MNEVNFDGLIGPTHNYAGLSFGNVASAKHKSLTASPKTAALQGLKKMRALHDLGIPQGILPPQERPHIPTLRRLGFSGSDTKVWQSAWQQEPQLATICCSASSMWVANAGTVSPAPDCTDQSSHITVANLNSMLHRSIEADTTYNVLREIFSKQKDIAVHPALPADSRFGDEGAANHTRLCSSYDQPGVELFVYGNDAFKPKAGPKRYPARQSLQASQAIARQHHLGSRAIFAQQNPAVIDAGVFHNDVIAVGNLDLLFYHEHAFADSGALVKNIHTQAPELDLKTISVADSEVSVDEAVSSYLFNSQLVKIPSRAEQTLIAPMECKQTPAVHNYLQKLTTEGHGIGDVIYFDLRESMRNGGGPACLRLRIVLDESQQQSLAANVIFTPELQTSLEAWINKHYRDELKTEDLTDPALIEESRSALAELTEILNLGPIYEFQQ